MRVAFDSTDSLRGGCTTHVALQVWRALSDFGVQGGPRLVRLNPNIPFKTRGNAAVCLDLGHGRGKKRLAGLAGGQELWAHERIEEPDASEGRRILETAARVIDEERADDAAAQTGLVTGPFDERAYWDAVRELVHGPIVNGGWSRAWGTGRGLIGAQAAAAWQPRHGTYELIAYRHPTAWGTPRRVSAELGPWLDAHVSGTFDNWDARHGHLRITPNTPCPILAGIRGTYAAPLERAGEQLGPETADAWMLFVTNQATGDHLDEHKVAQVRPYQSVRVVASVVEPATVRPGGHVFLPLRDETGTLTAAAYEPTKEFRAEVRALRTGDVLEVEGAAHGDASLLALEAFTLLEAVPDRVERRTCADCGGALQSKGRRTPRRCRACGTRAAGTVVVEARPRLPRVCVPTIARRHLSTPPHLTPERLLLPAGGIAA